MNHTRFPKEDHLPDWERRDNKDTKGDRVEHVGSVHKWDKNSAHQIFLYKYLMTLNQQNAQICPLDIYITVSHWTFLLASVCNRPWSGNHSKAIMYKTKLAIFVHNWHGVNSQIGKM